LQIKAQVCNRLFPGNAGSNSVQVMDVPLSCFLYVW
jgi:hypothetical protein